MKTRVKIIGKKFYTNPNLGTVVCELICDLQKEKHPAFFYLSPIDFGNQGLIDRCGIFRVKAKAKCAEGDTFDIKKGKMIAESRAKAKMHKIVAKVWDDYADRLYEAAAQCAITCHNCLEVKDIEEFHVKELIDETDY